MQQDTVYPDLTPMHLADEELFVTLLPGVYVYWNGQAAVLSIPVSVRVDAQDSATQGHRRKAYDTETGRFLFWVNGE